MNRFATAVLLLFFISGCSENDDSASENDRCTRAAEKAHERLVGVVEQAMWEHELYKTDKPVPEGLQRHGERIPIAEFTDEQLADFTGWKADNLAYQASAQRALNDIGDALDEMGAKGACAP